MWRWLGRWKFWRSTPQIMLPLTTKTTKQLGDAAENRALLYLQQQGLQLQARNVRYKSGELDLIMWELTANTPTLVFVEVRSRAGSTHGGALASIDAAKQRRIIAAAAQYLQTRKGTLPACRFDVVLLQAHTPPQWLKAAFTA